MHSTTVTLVSGAILKFVSSECVSLALGLHHQKTQLQCRGNIE